MKDYASDKDFVRRFRDGALAIARRKMDDVARHQAEIETVVPLGPRMATGGHFGGFFLWDTVFAVMWARHAPGDWPYLSALDNFYAVAEPADGFIGREFSPRGTPVWSSHHPVAFAPPLLSWAERVLADEGKSPAGRLAAVYPALKRHHEACRARFRRDDGLYFCDGLGCGMDDIPRAPRGMSEADMARGGIPMTAECVHPEVRGKIWDWLGGRAAHYSWNRQMAWIDASSQMAFDALQLAAIADSLGLGADAAAWRAEHAALAAAINASCWDEKTGFYYDAWEKGPILRKTAAAFWVLASRVAAGERAARVVAALKDPAQFNRPIPFPAVSADDPEDYQPETGYWRGVVWPPTDYIAFRGLLDCGESAFAEDAARRYYNGVAAIYEKTGTVWENSSPEQCESQKPWAGEDFCGWGAIAPVALPVEFGWL